MENNLNYKVEIDIVKNRLVNSSLFIGVVTGLPLLTLSIYRGFLYDNYSVPILNTAVYFILLLVAIFRKKISYSIRATVIIVLIFTLGLVDLYKIGFLSLAILWFNLVTIMTFLYFNIRKAIYTLVFALLSMAVLKIFLTFGFENQMIDLNAYNKTNLLFIIRAFNLMLVSLFVIFSMRQITLKFQTNIQDLANERNNLLNIAKRLRKEIVQNKKLEQHAIANEKKFKNIFDNSADPMVVVSKDGTIIDFNASFSKSMNNKKNLEAGSSIFSIIPASNQAFFEKYKFKISELPSRFDMKFISQKTGKYRYLDVSTAIVNFNGEESILAIFRDNTDKFNQESNIYTAALQAEEKERLRMSKELHDGLGPLLSTLKIYFEALEKHPDNTEIQKRIGYTIDESIKSVKEISNNLSPYVLQNLGIVKALNAFIDKICFANVITIQLDSDFDERFNDKVEISIYRLITELINNTLKHAHASLISITLHLNGAKLSVIYTDNGVGFETDNKKRYGGIGLFNMKSRIEKLGGSFGIESAPNKGFMMQAVLDVNQVN